MPGHSLLFTPPPYITSPLSGTDSPFPITSPLSASPPHPLLAPSPPPSCPPLSIHPNLSPLPLPSPNLASCPCSFHHLLPLLPRSSEASARAGSGEMRRKGSGGSQGWQGCRRSDGRRKGSNGLHDRQPSTEMRRKWSFGSQERQPLPSAAHGATAMCKRASREHVEGDGMQG